MANIFNPSDWEYFITKETVQGTTPATPAFSKITVSEGEFNLETAQINSEMKNANRAAKQGAVGLKSGSGSMNFEVLRSTAFENLLESVLSNTFVTNVLKGGRADSSYTIARRMTATDSQIFVGNIGSAFTLEASRGEMVTGSLEFTFMDKNIGTTAAIVTGSTFPAVTLGSPISGNDVTVTISGMTGVKYRSLSLSVNQAREILGMLGSNTPAGVGTDGSRETTLSVEAYREGMVWDSTFNGSNSTFDVTITLGAGANGYSIRLPKCTASFPQDSSDGASALVTIEFVATDDTVSGTEIIVTKLT